MKFAHILLFTLAFVSLAAFASAQPQEKPKNPLVGSWICEEEGLKVQIRADGSLTINDAEYAYKIKNSIITVISDEGALAMPFELDGDTLTVKVEGRAVVYTRVKPGAKRDAGVGAEANAAANTGIMQALVGKWCYMSNLTGANSYMSSRCFVLYANGTYEYSAESSSSGAYGGTAGQSYDSGRWTATPTTLTAISGKYGTKVYPIVLRNHPKTGDAMIVVDGDAYVTATQRRPW